MELTPNDRRAEQRDVDGPSNAAWPWERWRAKLGSTLRDNQQRKASPGLVQSEMKTRKDCKTNIRAPCSCFRTSNLVAKKSFLEQMTHGMPCKKAGRLLVPR